VERQERLREEREEEEGVVVGVPRGVEGWFLRRVSARRVHQPGRRFFWPRTGELSGVRVPPSLRRRAEVW
jgi:hypothetical protein